MVHNNFYQPSTTNHQPLIYMTTTKTGHNAPEFSISEISNALKRVVESNFSHVRLRGEISGYRGPHSSGHCYFSLKDEKAKIDAIIWRGVFGKLHFKPEEGMEVIATGKLSTFAGKSSYQVIIESLEPAGEGALMALLEKRKKQLAAEGLFDPARKQAIPFLPSTIAVITSPTGAVIRDILHRLRDRFPCHVLLWPVRVQGEGAAEEITAAIEGFNRMIQHDGTNHPPDLLIVARGGGSIEDLWPFNEENVARAVAASSIPVISAVGHETDTTLIDFVSDQRAPTPTAAAEMAVPVLADLLYTLRDHQQRMDSSMTKRLANHSQHVLALGRSLPKPSELLAQATQRLDSWAERLQGSLSQLVKHKQAALDQQAALLRPNALRRQWEQREQELQRLAREQQQSIQRLLERKSDQLTALSRQLSLLDHQNILKRGFALVQDENHTLVTHLAQAKRAKNLTLTFQDGSFTPTSSTSPKQPKKKKAPPPSSGQESLF
jgi:exodeoxyribonuclease VII large subunit